MEKLLTFDDINIVPEYSEVRSRSNCSTETDMLGVRLSLPIVPSNMKTVTGYKMVKEMDRLGSIGILHRFAGWKDDLREIAYDRNISRFAVSIGVNNVERELEFILGMFRWPAFIVIDVAHGHHILVKEAIAKCKMLAPTIPVIAGNIVTAKAAADLIEWGADGLKCGVGSGKICTTRIMTGIGIPQVSALLAVSSAVSESGKDIVVISDGGAATPGDIAKAFVVGADVVMSGSLFAGTRETPGAIEKTGAWPNERLFMKYSGSASADNKVHTEAEVKHVEGTSLLLPYKGKASRIFNDIRQGLQSSMSYVGADNIDAYKSRASFVVVSHAGAREAHSYATIK